MRKFTRYFLITLGSVFAIYLVLCFIGPKKFDVSRSISIHSPSSPIFNRIKDFAQWSTWSPWSMRDTAMKVTFTGTPGMVGHKQTWESKSQGNGTQEIVEIKEGTYLKTKLNFTDFDGDTYTELILKENGDSTTVTWTMDGSEIPWIGKGFLFLMGGNKIIEKDYDEGLLNLKKLIESAPAQTGEIAYDVEEMPELIFVGKRFQLNASKLDSALFASTFAELGDAIGGYQNMTGAPFSITQKFDEKTGDMEIEIALPVAKTMKVKSGLFCSQIKAGKCAKYLFTGPYEKTGAVWGPFINAVSKQHAIRGGCIESYIDDPTKVADRSKMKTLLIIPIE